MIIFHPFMKTFWNKWPHGGSVICFVTDLQTPVISIAILIQVFILTMLTANNVVFLNLCSSLVCVLNCCCSSSLPLGSTPSRSAGFLGTSSPGPMADLYGAASQESAVSSYLSAASPAPSTGFSHSLGVSNLLEDV